MVEAGKGNGGNGGKSAMKYLSKIAILEAAMLPEISELDNMVLTKDVREKVLLFIKNHDLVKRRFSELGIDNLITYGRGTAILIFGPPGTGKTLLAKSISRIMGKPLFGLNGEQNIKFNRASGFTYHAIEELFKVSQDKNGIVFIDECDRYMNERQAEYDTLLNELEKSDGVTIMATNNPEQIGKPFDRRISLKIELPVPDENMREQLWKIHIPEGVTLDNNADLRNLAKKYVLSGGYIKNAVIAALHRVFERDQNHHVITHEDLEYGASLQSPEVGVENQFYKVIKFQHGKEGVKLPDIARHKIDAVIRISKNLEYRDEDINCELIKGFKVMLWGDKPERLAQAAYTAAASLGRNIMQMGIEALSGEGHRERRKMTNTFFERAAATENVIVILDDCDYSYSDPDRLPEWLKGMFLDSFRQYRGLAFFAVGKIPGSIMNPLFHMEINMTCSDFDLQKKVVEQWLKNVGGENLLELDEKLKLLKLGPYQFMQLQENVKILSLAYDSPDNHIADIIREAIIPFGMLPNRKKILF